MYSFSDCCNMYLLLLLSFYLSNSIGRICWFLFLVSFMGFTLSLMKVDASGFNNEDKKKMYLIITKARRRGRLMCLDACYIFICSRVCYVKINVFFFLFRVPLLIYMW